MVASHRGLESLGRLLTLGVTTCTLTSLVLLPAILGILRPEAAADDDADDHHDDADDAADLLSFTSSAANRRQAA